MGIDPEVNKIVLSGKKFTCARVTLNKTSVQLVQTSMLLFFQKLRKNYSIFA